MNYLVVQQEIISTVMQRGIKIQKEQQSMIVRKIVLRTGSDVTELDLQGEVVNNHLSFMKM